MIAFTLRGESMSSKNRCKLINLLYPHSEALRIFLWECNFNTYVYALLYDSINQMSTNCGQRTGYNISDHRLHLKDMADDFADQFRKKIDNFPDATCNAPAAVLELRNVPYLLSFRPVTADEITRIVTKSRKKQCSHDPAPTWLVKRPSVVQSCRPQLHRCAMRRSLKCTSRVPEKRHRSIEA